MEFTRMNVGQMRRQAMERTQAKEQQSKDYQNKIENMSKHNVFKTFQSPVKPPLKLGALVPQTPSPK